VAPQITSLGTDAELAFFNDSSGVLFSLNRNTSPLWKNGDAQTIQNSTSTMPTTNKSISPAIIRLTTGAALAAWVDNSGKVQFSKQATAPGGTWAAASQISTATSGSPVSLAALPGGKAVVAIRGTTDNFLYTSFYDGTTWGAVTKPIGDVTIQSPAITHGVGGATAELAYVRQADHVIFHTRFDGTTWSQPQAVGGSNITSVAIASAP
jgi:hypothetical protein